MCSSDLIALDFVHETMKWRRVLDEVLGVSTSFALKKEDNNIMEQQDRIDQLVAENQELLALTKQAFVKREVEKESVPVDEEWEKFATEHAEELEALEKDEPRTATITRLMGILPYKVAASIIGILFTAGVAFAAIHIVRMVSDPKPQTMQAEQTIHSQCRAGNPPRYPHPKPPRRQLQGRL